MYIFYIKFVKPNIHIKKMHHALNDNSNLNDIVPQLKHIIMTKRVHHKLRLAEV